MIRRSPTRIELKLDDLQDFDYIQKAEKKKTPSAGVTVQEAQKLLRQERIGFRPLRSSTSGIPAVVFASGTEAAAALISFGNGGATIPANGAIIGEPIEQFAQTLTSPLNPPGNHVQQISTVTPAVVPEEAEPESDVTSPADTPDVDIGSTSAVDMSMSFDD